MKLKLYIVLAVFILALAACDNTTNPGTGLTPEQQANQEDFGSADATVTTETLQDFVSKNHMDTAGNYVVTVEGNPSIISAIELANGVKVSLRGSGTVKLDATLDVGIWSIITVDSGASLAIRGPTLELAAGKTGALVWVMDGGSLALRSGVVKGHATNTQSAVDVRGTFTMSGGAISGNTALQLGGGVSVHGTFTMSGGTISGNTTAELGGEGGGVFILAGTFTMSGGAISGNTGGRGGGVSVVIGTFTMSGGTISGNTTAELGGGVSVDESTFTKTGGIIYGKDEGANSNTAGADTKGHAVYYKDNTAANVKYRDTTLGKDDNISTTDLTSGWTP